jgi:hypothetical protein
MADFSDHVRLLVLALLALVVLFLLASMLEQRRFVAQVFWSIAIVVGVIWILAKWGGDLGRTV